MYNVIANLPESDKQVLVLLIQVFATIMMGLLAWRAACGQNKIADKLAKKELFKLRYENIYQEAHLLFEECYGLVREYNELIYSRMSKKKEI